MDYFGTAASKVNLFFVEEVPLGTAGSVKMLKNFWTIHYSNSGDALTDFDLSKAVDFHFDSESLATLVLTRVDAPLEYGVVITKSDGRIRRFLEKPGWGEVFSDQVNTGIYIMQPEVLQEIPSEGMYDFSKNLFPKLFEEQKPLYGCLAEGYWCDIGNIEQAGSYRYAVRKVNQEIAGNDCPRVWVGTDVFIDLTLKLLALQ